jgi:leucyl/phenylalanyl-tRNA--protein transferase
MPVHWLTEQLRFPPVEDAGPDGLLAVGGDLSPERLLLAYRSGIFPWYDKPPILWWYPDPRFVLFPEKLHVSKSMQQVLKSRRFSITINHAFESVIHHCRTVKRKKQAGSWINDDMTEAYTRLHEQGYAISVEAWQDNKLAGGFYGIRLRKIFFGESMFSLVSNASKAAFITYVRQLQQEGVRLIDCQVHTDHLASLGAGVIPGKAFKMLLQDALHASGL